MTRKTSVLVFLAAAFAIGCDSDGDGVSNGDDCAPDNADISPDAEEVCDGIDNNCDGQIDEGVTSTFYADADGDGFGDAAWTLDACEAPNGFVEDSTDCDDLNADANPDAGEVCDDVDNDCDGLVDADDDSVDASTGSTFYADNDGDGYGDAADSQESCSTPTGYADNADDCDDANSAINPETVWYADQDGDGFGSDIYTTQSCEPVDGYAVQDGDCDDYDANLNPDMEEVCNGIDDNCDGTVPADETDDDGDYYVECEGWVGAEGIWSGDCDDSTDAVNPGALEVCDGLDNDCDGNTDLTWNVPADYSTIQGAIDAAADGDGICVDAGTYTENLWLNGNSVKIVGASTETTIIDGAGADSVIGLDSGEHLELVNLTVTGGSSNYGGAIYAEESPLTLRNVLISDSGNDSGSTYGGALYVTDTNLTLDNVEFDGIVVDVLSSYGTVYGSVIYADGTNITANDVSIHDTYVDCYNSFYGFVDNDGGVSTWDMVDISDNWVQTDYSLYPGFYYGEQTVTNLTVNANEFIGTYTYSTLYPFFRSYNVDTTVTNAAFTGNSYDFVGDAYAGVAYAYYGTTDIDNLIYAGNTITSVDYLYSSLAYVSSNGTLFLSNADIVGNTTNDSYGYHYGMIRSNSSSGSTSIVNTNLVGNDLGAATAAFFYGSSGTIDLNYSNGYNNTQSSSYFIYEDGGEKDLSGAMGLIEADPLYTDTSDSDPANWDLTLASGSPAIDAGSPDILDADGTTSDIGAYGGPNGGSW